MTRINLVPPQELCDQHLLAEFRELTRIPNAVVKGKYKLDGQPKKYTLGTGHVKFFYDKLKFLFVRYIKLYTECRARGFNVEPIFPIATAFAMKTFWQGYEPTQQDIELNRARIKERMPKFPRFSPYVKEHV